MTIRIVDESQRKAARVAGFAFLFAMAIVVLANYGINFRLIIPGNAWKPPATSWHTKHCIRINIACNLIYVVIVVSALSALRDPQAGESEPCLGCGVLQAGTRLDVGPTALNTLGALRLLGDAAYLPVFGADQLQTLARLHLSASYDAYYVALPFWGLASTVCSYLWFKSRYIPRALAAFGVISSAWCVFCAFAFIVFPHFDATVGASWFDVPMVLFEMALGIWLLFKGLSPSGLAKPNKASV